MDKKELKDIKKYANELKTTFAIGKSGITDTFIETVENYLEANGLVKIKSHIATNKDELKSQAEEIAKKTESDIIDMKGFTFVLYR